MSIVEDSAAVDDTNSNKSDVFEAPKVVNNA